MEVPSKNINGLWETFDTNNDSWSYAWYDNNFKNPKETLHRLIATVARGGTYLFNVRPDEKGNIPEIGVKFLEETGKWIREYPQVVYGAGSSPWGHALPWGDVTTKGNSLFMSVFEWPQDGELYLPGLESKIISAELLGVKESNKIKFEQENGWTVFNVPFKSSINKTNKLGRVMTAYNAEQTFYQLIYRITYALIINGSFFFLKAVH